MLPGLIFYVLLSLFVAYFGRNRKFGFWAYLILSLLLSPLITFIIVLASDKRSAPEPIAPVETAEA